MERKHPRLMSLFDGSAGFCLAGAMHGIEPVYSSEIEPFCLRVESLRFPNCKQLRNLLADEKLFYSSKYKTFYSKTEDGKIKNRYAIRKRK